MWITVLWLDEETEERISIAFLMGFDKGRKKKPLTKVKERKKGEKVRKLSTDALSSSVFATGMFFGTTTNAWSTLTANVVSLLPPLPVVAHTRNCPLPRPKWPIRATTHVPHPTRYQPPCKSLCQVRNQTTFFTYLNNLYHKIRIVFSIFFDRD